MPAFHRSMSNLCCESLQNHHNKTSNCLNTSKGHFMGKDDLPQKTNSPLLFSDQEIRLQQKYAPLSIQQISEHEIKKSHFK